MLQHHGTSRLHSTCNRLLPSARPTILPPASRQNERLSIGIPSVRCLSVNDQDSTSTSSQPVVPSPSPAQPPAAPERIQRTMADLDALLGIQDEPKTNGVSTPTAATSDSKAVDISISSDALKKLADAEASRLGVDGGAKTDMEIQFQRIVEKARKLADEQSQTAGTGEGSKEELRREFEDLLTSITASQPVLSKDDIRKLKEAAFGPQTFFITETQPIQQAERTGLLIRGNLRDERDKVFQHICDKVTELFGDKYTVIMVEDAQAMQEEGTMLPPGMSQGAPAKPSGAAARAMELNTPRIAFQIIPSAQATPPQTTGWKQAIAFVLATLFLGSAGQLALAANITKLPKETLAWFANPANFESDQLPPGLENWDPLPYFSTAAPIFLAILGINIAHELGHRIAASVKGVRLGPTYFVPNFQIGSFGAITPFTSLLKDRSHLWDVSAAGPLAGITASIALLAVGLAQSQPGTLPPEALVPVPTQLFQGSLLLGGITRLALGETALRAAEIPVSPLVIAGWCGMISQALQLLPVGSVDGGRMVQAAYGQGTLSITSFFTYVGLGLGLLGSSLALPYGLYVIICQRTMEKYISDNVKPAGDARGNVTTAALMLAILVLLPMAPELADAFGIGPGSDLFY